MPLAVSTKKMIEECAGLNARMAKRLGPKRDFLVWASPTACRDPEETKLWHPVYTDRPPAYKMIVYVYLYCRYAMIGAIRCFGYRGFSYSHIISGSPALLVMAEEITDHSKAFMTDYIAEDPSNPVDKLIFSRIKDIGNGFTALGFKEMMYIGAKLEWELIFDFFRRIAQGKVSSAYLDSLALFHRWVISYSWCFHYDFYRLLERICAPDISKYRAVFLPHEMHFYSRMAWMAGKRLNIKRITAQHAMILPEKLWYFPGTDEVKAGCALPDIFYVYSDETRELLRRYYPGTDFRLCCSPRFRKWKDAGQGILSRGDALTFVSGIMAYDIAIIVKAIRALLAEEYPKKRKMRLRLHPAGIIDRAEKEWIDKAVKAGSLELSKVALKEEFELSAVVIGSNSAVLQEAVLSGVPALALTSKDYICASVLPESAEWTIDAGDITWKRVEEQAARIPDAGIIRRFRTNMGLDNPDLTTAMVYAA